MKRIALLLAAAFAVALVLTPGIAFANFSIHGGYTKDTDACAGCHRAHTSFSSVTWTDESDQTTQRSALLVSNATKMKDFCYACHGNDAQGAETNVEGGQYNGTLYGTDGAALNGGFAGDTNIMNGNTKTSDHIVDGSWGAYGGADYDSSNAAYFAGNAALATGELPGNKTGMGNDIIMTCASCHDPHGSSNYRLLKDSVNGNAVGGYVANVPQPYVISDEPGYPNGTNGNGFGWQKHEMGADQIVDGPYVPNYTKPMYAKGYDDAADAAAGVDNTAKGMSGWCVGCHTVYMQTTSNYNAGDDWGLGTRHRHPINITLADGSVGPVGSGLGLTVPLVPAAEIPLPLAGAPSEVSTNTPSDWLECLSCHVAHGTDVTMTGFANVASVITDGDNPVYDGVFTGGIEANSGPGGVPPTGDSALLRRPNRGVCEVCHDK